jgi:tRNA-splicing ligase RtcB
MNVMNKEGMLVPLKMWAEPSTLESGALDQAKNVSSIPGVFHHTALMPDAHQGYGSPIGMVAVFEGIVVPAIVGVDIGCGMCALKLNLHYSNLRTEQLKKIMGVIRDAVPVGNGQGGSHDDYQPTYLMPGYKFDTDDTTCPIVHREFHTARKQLGTLGGGNHFIEIQKDGDGAVWIMIHSGSRHLGKSVAEYYMSLAKQLNIKWKAAVPPSWQLAFLPLDDQIGRQYVAEMAYCVNYALANRDLMMDNITEAFCEVLDDGRVIPMNWREHVINIAHNYAAMEHHYGKNVMVHRKGATRARAGEVGIIPGSQGTKSYIVEGLGNKDSFESCSHGAGRRLSRSKACQTLSLEAEIKRLDDQGIVHGIRTEKDLDEAAGAYKNIEEVMAYQTDLVKPVVELTPMAVIKG